MNPAEYCERHREEYVQELCSWIAVPSVSADPDRAADVRRCCEIIVSRMKAIGLDAQVLETRGNPIAYGEWLQAPGKPVAIVYGHYDVQPADPLDLWETPPFTGTVRNGHLYGRGSVDDKGQVVMHLAAIEAHLRVNGKLPINVKVIIEGEEEIGSPNFEAALAANRPHFEADLAIISDTAIYAPGIPSLTTSVRGLVHWEITVQGPSEDLHSGYFGGIIANPLEALARLLASLKDERGRVRVPGFYDGVGELDERRRADLRALPFDENQQAREVGVPALGGETDRLALERQWFWPTLECNGLYGGYQGPGTKTIIPSVARAKLSARLAGDQDPQHVKRVVHDYLLAQAPAGVRVRVEASGDVRAVRTAQEHPVIAAAARAMEVGFGKKPVMIGSGGTIGPVSSFDRILHLPQILIGVGLPDDRIHAPNEKFTLSQFFDGITTMCRLYEELALPVDG